MTAQTSVASPNIRNVVWVKCTLLVALCNRWLNCCHVYLTLTEFYHDSAKTLWYITLDIQAQIYSGSSLQQHVPHILHIKEYHHSMCFSLKYFS